MRAEQFEKKERQLRAALQETAARLGRHFANPSARASAGAYLQSLLSTAERKNSWQLAEVAGLETPYRFQHLLGRGACALRAGGESRARWWQQARCPRR